MKRHAAEEVARLQPPQSVTFYTPQEVAGLLKLRVQTVYDYIRSGKLAAARLGNRYRISNSDLEAFLQDLKREAAPQPITSTRLPADWAELSPEERLARIAVIPPGTTAEQRLDAMIRLVEEWMQDDSGYDEEAWPQLKEALNRDHSSYRRLFPE